MNTVSLTGRIKNIKTVGATGQIVTATLSQYDINNQTGKEFCVFTMPLVFIGNGDSALGMTDGTVVTIKGAIKTRFDRRPGIANENRFKPLTQIAVAQLEEVR